MSCSADQMEVNRSPPSKIIKYPIQELQTFTSLSNNNVTLYNIVVFKANTYGHVMMGIVISNVQVLCSYSRNLNNTFVVKKLTYCKVCLF